MLEIGRNLQHLSSSDSDEPLALSSPELRDERGPPQTQMQHLALFDLQYAFRAKTEAVFDGQREHVFDFFVLDDPKYEDFYLFKNVWRETLLLHSLTARQDPSASKVLSFGQLPNKIIFREVEEAPSISLEEYLRGRALPIAESACEG